MRQKLSSRSCEQSRGGRWHPNFVSAFQHHLIAALLGMLLWPVAGRAEPIMGPSHSAAVNIRVSVAPTYRLKAVGSVFRSTGRTERTFCYWTNALVPQMSVVVVLMGPSAGVQPPANLSFDGRPGSQIFPCVAPARPAVSEFGASEADSGEEWVIIRPE